MNDALNHKCPSCDAVLKFNPHGQNWKCEYCKSEFNLEEIEKSEKKKGNTLEEKSTKKGNIDVYICSACGASIIADENTSATSCVYCKNTAILKDKLQDEFNPELLIPFRNTKEDAIAAFKKLGKGRIFMPKAFNDINNINEMSGIYIPFWLYDYEASGVIEADCKRISTWRSGDYRYTKTDDYLVTRGGNMEFLNIPTDGSKRFNDDIMNSIEPFNYEDLKKFNYSYLSGFLSEKYDVSKEEAQTSADDRAKKSFIDQMKKDMVGYNTVVPVKNDIKLTNNASRYVLLPVWMLNIKYKEKIYTFAMNGQTGKMIGDIPIDKKKAVIMWLLIFFISFGILLLISYLGVIK